MSQKNLIKEIDWDHNVEGDAVEGSVVCVCREEVFQALDESWKSTSSS